jgi:hypothetical protein
VIAPLAFILQDDLEEVELGEFGLSSVSDPIGKGWQQAGELEALEHGFERLADFKHGR